MDAADEESLANLSAKIDGARSLLELSFADDEVSVARSQEDIRYADKIRRSFERLRRAAVKTMEGLFSKGTQGRSEAIKSRRNSIKAIVERCTYVLGDLVTVVSSQIQPVEVLSDNHRRQTRVSTCLHHCWTPSSPLRVLISSSPTL